jgi:deazaflavin-dependent oxidoreductase (nitroreductase family)
MTSTHPTAATTSDRERIGAALAQGGTVDITTHGRKTGQPRRIEIVFFNFDGRVYISGMPGRRGWYANLLGDPTFTFHLKGRVSADLPARAIPITDGATRRAFLARITRQWRRESQLEAFLASSPLIEVTFDDPTLLPGS